MFVALTAAMAGYVTWVLRGLQRRSRECRSEVPMRIAVGLFTLAFIFCLAMSLGGRHFDGMAGLW